MAYNEQLANRVRQRLADLPNTEEKLMMGGLTFMVNSKMCVGVMKDELMCRIDPAFHAEAAEQTGCRTMAFTDRPLNGYVLIDETGFRAFDYWIDLALAYNPHAKATKKKKSA